ncbi:MAG TPA: response regulator [Tepidisphaeraceae bacterium]|jgi:CheY-like chemotaxis protein
MMRLIVVENDPLLSRAIVAVLRRDGIEVLNVSSNGVEALEALKNDLNPDLILTDRDMPGGSGLDLVDQLRKAGNETPVVMLSGHSEPEDVALATAVGVNRYLIKPVTADLLTAAVRQTYYAAAA